MVQAKKWIIDPADDHRRSFGLDRLLDTRHRLAFLPGYDLVGIGRALEAYKNISLMS
jgi:hypothetical protein